MVAMPRMGLVLLLATPIWLGCRQKPAKGEKEAADAPSYLQEPRRLAPFHVRSVPKPPDDPSDRLQTVEIYDAAQLFQHASVAYRVGDYAGAREMYRRVLEEFPLSEYAPPSLYNIGLCYEHLEQFADARDAYARLVGHFPSEKDVTDALFRMMGCAEVLETWEEVVTIADRILTERGDVTVSERVECLARKGAALVAVDEDVLAAASLKEAVYRFNKVRTLPGRRSNYYAAMARFKLGEILEKKMHRVALPADEDKLQAALEAKCGLLLDAQVEYTDVVRMGEAHWAAAAAYRIGRLYRVLWEDMTEAPPPPDLNTEEREIYLDIMKDKIQVLLVKAIRQWERVIRMAERLEFNNEWVTQTRSDLEDIRKLMITEPGSSASAGETSVP